MLPRETQEKDNSVVKNKSKITEAKISEISAEDKT